MISLKFMMACLSATAALVAALLWVKASVVEVAYDPNRSGARGAVVFYEGDKQWDVIQTAKLQTRWNRRAAIAAAVAAGLQAIVLLMPDPT